MTGTGDTLVAFHITVESRESLHTFALVHSIHLDAGSIIETGIGFTGTSNNVTSPASETLWAVTHISLPDSLTGAPVGTRLLLTVVDLHLTVCPHEAAGTVTGVAALAGVLTDPSISTGRVVGAVVQVLVTEESSPALPTIALPGLRACAVQTSGVPNARVAEVAFVSSPTLALARLVTEPVVWVAAGQTHSLIAVVAFPSLHADFLSVLVADIVPERVIPGSAVVDTPRSVVVLPTLHFVRVLQRHGVLGARELFP